MSDLQTNIEVNLNEAMKTAMKAKDKPTLQAIRMAKAAMQERVNGANPPKEVNDGVWQEVIASYCKKLGKSADEYRKLGEAGAGKLADIEYEISVLKPYLPALIEGAELETIVKEAISTAGATEPKDTGKVMGLIMKNHKGKVDSGVVKKLVQTQLGG